MNKRQVLTTGILLVGCNLLSTQAYSNTDNFNTGAIHSKTLLLPNGLSVNYQAESINGYSIAEKDILLGVAPRTNAFAQSRGSAVSIAAGRWPDGIIPYQFASNLTDSGIRTRVEEAIEHWNDSSSIRLVQRTASNAKNFEDYLEFTESTGCASYVGRIGGPQEIWVSDSCSTGSMIHEIGHALGLLHEHTRNDRDQYIMVNYANVVEGKEHNFAIPSSNGKDIGNYDYASIMHYGAYFFSRNGEPTISPFNDLTGINMGQRIALSEGDIAAIDSIYTTDLALTVVAPDIVGVEQAFTLDLNVTNQGDQGANEVMIIVPLDSSNKLLSWDGPGWECEQQASKIVCGRANLAEYSQTSLVLNLKSGFEPPESIKVNLSSRTADFNKSNNGDVLEEAAHENTHETFFEEPLQIANAGAATTVGSADGGSGGGGMLHLLNYFLLGLLVLFRKTR